MGLEIIRQYEAITYLLRHIIVNTILIYLRGPRLIRQAVTDGTGDRPADKALNLQPFHPNHIPVPGRQADSRTRR